MERFLDNRLQLVVHLFQLAQTRAWLSADQPIDYLVVDDIIRKGSGDDGFENGVSRYADGFQSTAKLFEEVEVLTVRVYECGTTDLLRESDDLVKNLLKTSLYTHWHGGWMFVGLQ